MSRLSRRSFLRIGAISGGFSSAGCLRLAGPGGDSSQNEDNSEGTDFVSTENEEVSVEVVDTWGPEAHREVRWSEDALTLTCGHENPSEDGIDDESVGGTIDIATGEISLSGISQIQYTYRHRSIPGDGIESSEARQDVSYFAIADHFNYIGQKTILADASDLKPDNENIDLSMYLKDEGNTGRVSREFDTTDISGPRHIGVGANVGSDTPQLVELTVFDIRGTDRNGNTVFRFDTANQVLRG